MSKLTKNLVYLVNNLSNIELVLCYLVQEDIISNNDRERIVNQLSKTDQCSELFSVLNRKEWNAIEETVLQILRETQNGNLADKIQSTQIEQEQPGRKSANTRILQCLPYLTENLSSISTVLNYLISEEMMDFQQRSIIMSKVGDDQSLELFSFLLKKNLERNLHIVIDILRKTGNGHLANRIIQCS